MESFYRKFLGNIAILLLVSALTGQAILFVNAEENWIWSDANGVHFRGKYYDLDTNATGEIDFYNKSGVKLGSGFKYVVTQNFTKLNASLVNTSFENVDPTSNQPYNFTFRQGLGHTIESTTVDKYTGSYSLRINTTGASSWSGISQEIKGLNTTGEVYDKLSVWVKATVPGMRVRILIRNWELPNHQGKELEYFCLWGGYAPLTWTEVFRRRWAWTSGKIGSSFLSITLNDYGKTGSVYFDDIGWEKYHVDEYMNTEDLSSTYSSIGNVANITNSFSLQGLAVTRTYSVWKDSPKIKVTFDVNYQSNIQFYDEYIRGYVLSTSGKFLPKESYNMTDLTAETIENLHAPKYARNFVDRYTPHILFFDNDVSFVDIDNTDGWYVMLEDASTKIEYIADTVWNHPYFNRQSFTGDLQSSLTTHSDNELRSYALTFYVGYTFNQDEYPIVLRQPYGYLATWIVTDHADRDRINELKALMYGSSLLDEAQPGLGFVGKGLMVTKSVFPYSTSTTSGLGLNNATFLNLVRQLYNYGIEIVPHSLTNSEVYLKRQEAEQRLIIMDEFSPKVWIDHGGIQVNLHNKGWMTNETDYYILDLLQAHGYKYDWSYIDLDAIDLNMLHAPATPDEGFGYFQPTYMNNFYLVQEHPRASLFDLYEFTTHLGSGAYHTYADVGGATTPGEIDMLINNKGIAILHTYMTSSSWLNKDYISIGNGHFNMSSWLSNQLEYMRTKMYSERELLVTTVSNWMDYVLGMDSVTIEPDMTMKGKFTLRNTEEIIGLSLWFRKNVKSARIDGRYTMGVVNDRIWLPKLAVGTHTLEVEFGTLDPTIPNIREDSEPFVAGTYDPIKSRIYLSGSSMPNITLSVYVVIEEVSPSLVFPPHIPEQRWLIDCADSQYSISWDSSARTLTINLCSDGAFQCSALILTARAPV